VLLAIEVDGGTHGALKVQKADRKKEAFLRSCGWCVLRFQNRVILRDLGSVLRLIQEALESTT